MRPSSIIISPGRSLEDLGCDLQGHVTRESHHHAPVGQRLEHHVGERRTAAVGAGDRVYVLVLQRG